MADKGREHSDVGEPTITFNENGSDLSDDTLGSISYIQTKMDDMAINERRDKRHYRIVAFSLVFVCTALAFGLLWRWMLYPPKYFTDLIAAKAPAYATQVWLMGTLTLAATVLSLCFALLRYTFRDPDISGSREVDLPKTPFFGYLQELYDFFKSKFKP